MARPPTGQVIERRGKRGTSFGLRFRAYGERRYVTSAAATRPEAELELQNILADVRRGIWRPPAAEVMQVPAEEPTFHAFASEWFAARKAEGLASKTLVDLKWSLSNHLLPVFAPLRLSEITPRTVDAYKIAKTQERATIDKAREQAHARGERFSERGLSNASINHTLRHLAQILETAVEYELITSNPATGRRRRLKVTKPARPWVEPEQLMAFLESASGVGRVLLEILAGGGLRIGEALALRWQHVQLGTGTLYVVDAKTAKGVREVHLTPALREALTLWRATSNHARPDDFVIATSTGRKHNPSNLRRDVLAPAVKVANGQLERDGIAPIGAVTFHSLRRTYASLRCACGDDVRYTADQIGHEDPRFTLRVYAQATKRRDRLTGPHLTAYDAALAWAALSPKGAVFIELAMETTPR
jgi:integrase